MTTGSKSTPPVRQRDPSVRHMLGALLELEASPWPAAMRSYGAMLVALSARCERCQGAKAEVYRWYMRELAGSLVVHGPERRECLQDALHEAVARIPGLLLHFRAGLDASKAPNFRSMLAAWVRWRAKDLYRSTWRRHADRRAELVWDGRAAPGSQASTVEANEVLALLGGEAPTSRALRMVGLGYGVAEAARRTGVSRQAIYRARRALRALIDGDES